MPEDAAPDPGSNNWVVSGAKTDTGKPIVANDPHREVTNPSLRYIVHLNAPGWNVIGAQEAAVCRRRTSATTSASRGASRSPAPISTTCSSRK